MPSSPYKVVIAVIMHVNWFSVCVVFVMRYVYNVFYEVRWCYFGIKGCERQWWGYSVDGDNNEQKQSCTS